MDSLLVIENLAGAVEFFADAVDFFFAMLLLLVIYRKITSKYGAFSVSLNILQTFGLMNYAKTSANFNFKFIIILDLL